MDPSSQLSLGVGEMEERKGNKLWDAKMDNLLFHVTKSLGKPLSMLVSSQWPWFKGPSREHRMKAARVSATQAPVYQK